MTVLSKRETWGKLRPQNETRRSSDLTPEEQKNVRAAIRFLRTRMGGNAKLAAALRANRASVDRGCLPNSRPSAGLALRVARVAGVPLEDVLQGAWPPAGACPHCGGYMKT